MKIAVVSIFIGYMVLSTLDLLSANYYFKDYEMMKLISSFTHLSIVNKILAPGNILAFIVSALYGVYYVFVVQGIIIASGTWLIIKGFNRRDRLRSQRNSNKLIDDFD